MNIRRFLLLFFLLAGPATLQAQSSFGLKAGMGLSRITGYAHGRNSEFVVLPSPSTAMGLYGQLGIGKRFLLRSEVLRSLVTDQYRLKISFTDINGVDIGEFSITQIWRNVAYLSIPMMAGIRFNRFELFLGAQASLALKSWARDKGWGSLNFMPIDFENKYPSMHVRPFDVGPKVAATYLLSDRLSLEMSYYHGLNAIQQSRNFPFPFRVRQLLIGMQMKLYSVQGGLSRSRQFTASSGGRHTKSQ